MSAPYFFESDDPGSKLIKTAANGKLAPDFNLKLLFLLAKADANGKIADNNRKGEETVLLVEEAAKENGCLTEPKKFSNPFTEYAYLSGKRVAPNAELYNDTDCEVILLCGLPGTGKDTWIGRNQPEPGYDKFPRDNDDDNPALKSAKIHKADHRGTDKKLVCQRIHELAES